MKNYGNIDISDQCISYLSDIAEKTLTKVTKIIFLYDPEKQITCDHGCKIDGQTPYEYLRTKNIPIEIHAIPDPYGVSEEKWTQIYDAINDLVNELIRKR